MKAAPGKNYETALDQGHDNAQVTLMEYLDVLNVQVREHGEEAARRGDPDAFDDAIAAIRECVGLFSADDIVFPGSRTVFGAAFNYLRKAGEIECIGYAISRRAARHGGLCRQWRST
jgi:hypothetical protein